MHSQSPREPFSALALDLSSAPCLQGLPGIVQQSQRQLVEMWYSIPASEKQVGMEPGAIPTGGALGTQMLAVSRHHDLLNVTVTLGS